VARADVLILPAMLSFMMLTILFLAAHLEPSSTKPWWIIDIYGFLMPTSDPA
jgi:MFS transporter, DHA2 family, multidrug resistance protein